MLLSSVAEAMYWTGRYVERAQALARVVLAYERLSFDLPTARKLELAPLFALVDRAPDPAARLDRAVALRAMVLDVDNPSSVLGALVAARENLRCARVVVPVELWTTVSALVQRVKDHAQGPEGSVLEVLEATLALGGRFEGERQASMTHDSAYAFLEMGCNVERADMLVQSLRVLSPALLPRGWERAYDDVRWTGLLHALGLHSAYRRLYHHQADLSRLLGLALSDANCPRAVAHCLRAIEQQLRQLPHAGKVRAKVSAALHCALAVSKDCADWSTPELSRLLDLLSDLNAAIAGCYFSSERELSPRAPVADATRPRDPFEHLGREHAQVDTVLGVLETLVMDTENGQPIDRRELRMIVSFLTDCGELGHHEKEESILTPVLVAHGFDWYEGPLANMRREHRQEHYFIRVLTELASQRDGWSNEDARSFASVAREFCHFLHAHMDHEWHDLFDQAARTLPEQVKDQLCKAFEDLDARQGREAAGSRAAMTALVDRYQQRAVRPSVTKLSAC